MEVCKLDRLMTEFQPSRMILHVELVPPKGTTFEAPLKDPGKKLNMIANYARQIFDVEMRQKLKKRGVRPCGAQREGRKNTARK
jgi:hypothetical protein